MKSSVSSSDAPAHKYRKLGSCSCSGGWFVFDFCVVEDVQVGCDFFDVDPIVLVPKDGENRIVLSLPQPFDSVKGSGHQP